MESGGSSALLFPPCSSSLTLVPGSQEVTTHNAANTKATSDSDASLQAIPKKVHSSSRRSFILDSLADALAGAMAGALAKTAVAPIERVKLLMQLSHSIEPLQRQVPSFRSGMMKSSWSVAREVYDQQGIQAFWRGNAQNVIRQGGTSAMNFMLMDQYKRVMEPVLVWSESWFRRSHAVENRERNDRRRRLLASFLSGGLAGGSTTTVLYPIDFLRTRLAMDMGSSLETRLYPRGMRDVISSIWRTDGVRGFYQGYGIALSGVVVYRALHLGGYDACKGEVMNMKMQKSSNDRQFGALSVTSLTMGERFVIAQVVSLVAGTLCYPIDSVRRRLMMQAGKPADARPYKNSFHAFRRIFVEEGTRGFFLGLGPNIVRSVSGALLLVTYDVLKDMLK